MTALKITGTVVLVLFLLSLVRFGAWVEYGQSGATVKIKLGPFRFTVFPGKPRKKPAEKKQKPKPTPKDEQKPGPPDIGGALSLVKEFLPLVAGAAGRVRRTIRIDTFYLDLTMGASDPAMAALSFGGANAILGMLWPPVEQNFKVKDYRLRTAVNFDLQAPTVWLQAAATLTIGQAVSLGVHLALRALSILRAHQRAVRAKRQTRTPAQHKTQKEAV